MTKVLMLICFLHVCATQAADWEIEVFSSGKIHPTMTMELTVTFYERGYTYETDAPNATLTLNEDFHSECHKVINISIPEITRPRKIDVWYDGTKYINWRLLKLTMKSESHTFTFECNCWLGPNHYKTAISPEEDAWELQATEENHPYASSESTIRIISWDIIGVNHTNFIIPSTKGTKLADFYLTIHLSNIVKIRLFNVNQSDTWMLEKIVLIHLTTCRSFNFGGAWIKAFERTLDLMYEGILPNCSTKTTATATCDERLSNTTDTIMNVTQEYLENMTISNDETVTVDQMDNMTTSKLVNVKLVPSEDASNNVSSCCLCVRETSTANLTIAELETIVKHLEAELAVNKTTLSATIRKKISAPDSRTSSKVIGVTAAVFMAIPVILMAAADLWTLCQLFI